MQLDMRLNGIIFAKTQALPVWQSQVQTTFLDGLQHVQTAFGCGGYGFAKFWQMKVWRLESGHGFE
jgi:hypothetical protein